MGDPGAPRRAALVEARRPHCLHVSDDELLRGGRLFAFLRGKKVWR